jgi:undecaprenyl-diphosphatase
LRSIGALLAVIVARTISFVVPFRLRPMYDPTVTHPQYSLPMSPDLENWSAFPSDTASLFFALAFGLSYLLRRLAIPIMFYAAVWICLPRVYLGVHYPSDIVAGAAIGAATVWVLLRTEWLQSRIVRHIVAVEETSPHWFYAIAFLVCFETASVFFDFRNVGRGALHLAMRGSQHGLQHGDMAALVVWLAVTCLVLIICFAIRYVSLSYRKQPSVNLVLKDRGSVLEENRRGNC